ncbi:hypothetical protein FRC06_011675 [Ceratobasidium sp. 370]|nr:hypothetical protein FRC06_011675 [Ceratobasidium sp. 370]
MAQPPHVSRQPTAEDPDLDLADFEPVTHAVSDRLRDPIPGGKPHRTEWHGTVQQILDWTTADAKASLIAAGYMKTAEERELIILQAWDWANEFLKQHRPTRIMTRHQVRYVQNLFPSCCKLIKTRLEGFISGEYHLRDGTHDQIHNRVERELLPHGFHSCRREGDLGPLPFEHEFLANALAIMIFRDLTDLGFQFNTLFNPIPPRLLALTCAMIANIIGEYNSSVHISKPTHANIDRLQNLLLQLHNNCIVLSGAFKDPVAEEPNNVIAIEQFDATPVEWYQPRYDAAQLAAMATRANIIDDDDMEADQDANEGTDKETDKETDQSGYGEAGPGPSTLRNRQARAMEPDEFDWEGYPDDEDSLDDHMHDM